MNLSNWFKIGHQAKALCGNLLESLNSEEVSNQSLETVLAFHLNFVFHSKVLFELFIWTLHLNVPSKPSELSNFQFDFEHPKPWLVGNFPLESKRQANRCLELIVKHVPISALYLYGAEDLTDPPNSTGHLLKFWVSNWKFQIERFNETKKLFLLDNNDLITKIKIKVSVWPLWSVANPAKILMNFFILLI